jgi:Flp pilus assembly protein TadG
VNLRADEDASAMIEFAITMPLVIFIFLATVSFALVVRQNIEIIDAASAGAKYGANGNSTNIAGMQTAAINDAADVPGFSVTASRYCSCVAGGATVSCTSSCSLYPNTPAAYVTVTTSAPGPLLFKVVGLPSSLPLSATSTIRVPWTGQ